jgi:hypothetical protein
VTAINEKSIGKTAPRIIPKIILSLFFIIEELRRLKIITPVDSDTTLFPFESAPDY